MFEMIKEIDDNSWHIQKYGQDKENETYLCVFSQSNKSQMYIMYISPSSNQM